MHKVKERIYVTLYFNAMDVKNSVIVVFMLNPKGVRKFCVVLFLGAGLKTTALGKTESLYLSQVTTDKNTNKHIKTKQSITKKNGAWVCALIKMHILLILKWVFCYMQEERHFSDQSLDTDFQPLSLFFISTLYGCSSLNC